MAWAWVGLGSRGGQGGQGGRERRADADAAGADPAARRPTHFKHSHFAASAAALLACWLPSRETSRPDPPTLPTLPTRHRDPTPRPACRGTGTTGTAVMPYTRAVVVAQPEAGSTLFVQQGRIFIRFGPWKARICRVKG